MRGSATSFPRCSIAVASLEKKIDDGILGFYGLPFNDELVDEINTYASSVKERFTHYVHVGIGGSSLGPIALQSSLRSSFHNSKDAPKMYFPDNVDPDWLAELIEEIDVEKIDASQIQEMRIRSVLTCDTGNGVCCKCYGRDLARGTPVNMGEAVGVIAAQSIGEPGTQLTMRTFHIGGTAQVVDSSFIESNFDGTVKIHNRNIAKDSQGRLLAMGRNMSVAIVDADGNERASQRVTYGSLMRVDEGDKVKRGQRLAEWDPYTRPILTETDGIVELEDLVDAVSVNERTDEATGITNRVIVDWRKIGRAHV